MNENVLMVGYQLEDDFVDAQPNTNTVIASFVTCYARLKLLQVVLSPLKNFLSFKIKIFFLFKNLMQYYK